MKPNAIFHINIINSFDFDQRSTQIALEYFSISRMQLMMTPSVSLSTLFPLNHMISQNELDQEVC
jgi:hypothetical protein